MTILLSAHRAYIAKIKAKGGRTLTFTTPCCAQKLEDSAPNDVGTWSTLAQCPLCESLFFKVTTHDQITALIPPGEKRCTCATNGVDYCRRHTEGRSRDSVRGS